LQIKTKIVSCHTADSKPVKQEVSSTVILPPLVFPVEAIATIILAIMQADPNTQIKVLEKSCCPECIKFITDDIL
jgi:hypothetical protein